MSDSYSISAGKIHTGNGSQDDAYLTVDGESIGSVGKNPEQRAEYDLSDYILLPAYSDIHTHGYFGIDAYFGEKEQIEEWGEKLFATGVSSFVPSLVSLPIDSILEQFRKYNSIIHNQRRGAKVLGIRCEGPYLSKEKRGAHNIDYLRTPDLDEIEELFRKGQGILKIIDIAPETGDFAEIVRIASKYGIRVSAGHSNATYKQSTDAFESGASIVTHFYNAMSNLTHSDSGMVGAGLLNTKVPLEIIADFHHVPPESIRIIDRMRGMGRIVLISDSLPIGGSTGGNFSIGGLEIIEKDGVAWIKGTDTIAGSVLTMDRAVQNLSGMGLPLGSLAHAAATIQAEILGLEHTGTLEPGKSANIVVLDRKLKVAALINEGRVVFDRNNLF